MKAGLTRCAPGMTPRRKCRAKNWLLPITSSFTTDPADLAAASIYIVTVPTPIDAHKRPDLTPLIKASETLGRSSSAAIS